MPLAETIDRETVHLRALPPDRATLAPRPGAWSPKQELGHLIDSAVNNHHRFVRAALDGAFTGPGYQQDGWVDLIGYQEMPWETLIETWAALNRLIAATTARIPADRLTAECRVGGGEPVSLGFLIEDYELHLQHHLDHLLGRAEVTRYPR